MQKWRIVRLLVGGAIGIFIAIFLLLGFNEESVREAIRWSARFSFVLFCLAFVASSLRTFKQNRVTDWLLSNRKYIGVSFALIHFIHLAFLGILQYFFHPVFELAAKTSLIGGGGAYLFIFLMFITSFSRFSQYLSSLQWKIVHTIGGYWIWSVFMTSYSKRAMTEFEHIPLVVILVFVFGLRMYSVYCKRRQNVQNV